MQPVAVRSSIDVFGLNRRVVLEMDTEQFGQVVYVIIGAVQVGSICLSVWQGQTVTKVGHQLKAVCFSWLVHTKTVAYRGPWVVMRQTLACSQTPGPVKRSPAAFP